MTVFCYAVSCVLVKINGCLKYVYCLHQFSDDEAISLSKTLDNFYETTRRNIPGDICLQIRRNENLKSHKITNIILGEQRVMI
jgi:hypothetical protein